MIKYVNQSMYEQTNEKLIERFLPGTNQHLLNQTTAINSLQKRIVTNT